MSDCQQPSTKLTIKDGCHMLLVMLDMQDLCRKCIKHNASCGKAWERLGSILEREQAYKVSFVAQIGEYSLCKARSWLRLHLKWPFSYRFTYIEHRFCGDKCSIVVNLCRMLLNIMKTPGSTSSNLHQPLATSLHSTI